ncbi:MAG: N-acetyltransferase family protein [Dehalococcoidia bacterium]
MATIRKVDATKNTERLFRLFEENSRDATHARAVIAEGAADLWVAEDAGRLVGALLGRRMRSSNGALRGGVDNLLVDAPHRRRGLGRQLMEEAEAFYRNEAIHGMQLAVNAENVVARSLYDSMGYQIVDCYTRRRVNAAGKTRVEQRLRMAKDFGSGAPERTAQVT